MIVYATGLTDEEKTEVKIHLQGGVTKELYVLQDVLKNLSVGVKQLQEKLSAAGAKLVTLQERCVDLKKSLAGS